MNVGNDCECTRRIDEADCWTVSTEVNSEPRAIQFVRSMSKLSFDVIIFPSAVSSDRKPIAEYVLFSPLVATIFAMEELKSVSPGQ